MRRRKERAAKDAKPGPKGLAASVAEVREGHGSAPGEASDTAQNAAPSAPADATPKTAELVQADGKDDKPRGWLRWFVGKGERDAGVVTRLPGVEWPFKEIKLQEYIPGTTYSRVVFDAQRSRHLYQSIEPALTEREKKARAFIKEVLVRTLEVTLDEIDRAASGTGLEFLEERVRKVAKDYRISLSPTGLRRVSYYLQRDFAGYGPIDVMMHDPEIEDISCDGAATEIFLYHRRHGSMASNVRFSSPEELDGFVIRMAQRSGKQITIADPLLDSSLPDGSRLQATLGREVTDNGSTFTIRRFRENPFSPVDLVRMGTMSPALLAYCWIIVQFGANVMLAGGTASGKTTTLNTVALFIPPQSKIVSIEDTREINLPHANWVRSMTRGGMRATDAKRVDMFDLLTAALRQRPEFVLVGEVRGKEATVAFQAMATGHTVLGTIHADSPRSVVYRLESEPINIPRIVIQALDVIMMQALVTVQGRRQRRVQQVAEIVGIDPASKELLTHDVFTRDPATDLLHYTGHSYKLDRIAQRNNWGPEDLDREFRKRTDIINALAEMPHLTFEQVASVFARYESQPGKIDEELEKLRAQVGGKPGDQG